MVLCTECYIQKDNKTLMLYRNKKKDDINAGKWIGIGGKLLPGESPEECLLREVMEEAGVTLTEYRLRGFITFAAKADDGALIGPMYWFVYTATAFTGEIGECDEGTLEWINNDKLMGLDLWEGDRIHWEILLSGGGFFSVKYLYRGDRLESHSIEIY